MSTNADDVARQPFPSARCRVDVVVVSQTYWNDEGLHVWNEAACEARQS